MKQSLFNLSITFCAVCLVVIALFAIFIPKTAPKCHDWTKLRSIREDATGQLIIDAPLIACPSDNWVHGKEVPVSNLRPK